MFGTNKLEKQRLNDGSTLLVKSIFPTIQGEGPFVGCSSTFVRLGGCHLRCFFCDTDFENGEDKGISDILTSIVLSSVTKRQMKTPLVVLTGGEPLRQNILPLCEGLVERDYVIQIETSGTYWVPGLEELCGAGDVVIVCSPKTGQVHPKIQRYCRDWKYLIRDGEIDPTDGLPIMSTQVVGQQQRLFRPAMLPDSTIWLQPCEEYVVHKSEVTNQLTQTKTDQAVTSYYRDEEASQRNVRKAVELVQQFNYRLTLQTHKLLGLP